ncbi:MAG: hypothetical protein EU531_04390 [Promethearchaeota archaeon]|nr:MAG: hypothetical protein EU531_04390 [Candidatus Lokiarchaeota archaeon]
MESFRLTKNLSKARKRSIRMRIKNRIKKKYLIETLYGNKCLICGEFNTKDHIRTFNFCYVDPRRKTCQASDLFNTYTCSEIADILEKEKGVYICSNCHTVLDMDYYDIIEDIYDSEEIIKKVKDDYHRVKNRIEKISKISLQNIKDPLTKNKIFAIRENVIVYFNAIYELSQENINITNKSISKKSGIDYSGVKSFFFRRRDFLKRYINFDIGSPTIYKLTQKGENFVSLINYFRRHFQTLELNECVDCKYRRENECIANKPDQCPFIKSGTHLPFDLDE